MSWKSAHPQPKKRTFQADVLKKCPSSAQKENISGWCPEKVPILSSKREHFRLMSWKRAHPQPKKRTFQADVLKKCPSSAQKENISCWCLEKVPILSPKRERFRLMSWKSAHPQPRKEIRRSYKENKCVWQFFSVLGSWSYWRNPRHSWRWWGPWCFNGERIAFSIQLTCCYSWYYTHGRVR